MVRFIAHIGKLWVRTPFRCFPEQNNLPSCLSTGWFQEQI